MDISATVKKYIYVMDLPESDKAIFVNVGTSLLYLTFACFAYFAEHSLVIAELMNLETVHLAEKVGVISALLMSIFLIFIFYMRKVNPKSELPNNIQIYLIGQPLMIYAVLNGVTQLVTGLLLGMLPLIGVILFNRKHVFYAASLLWIEIVVLAFAVSLGYLPNAPLYISHVKAEQVPFFFTFAQLLMSGPVAAIVYVMGHSLMQGLVLKEKKILELSRTDVLTGLWNRRYLNELLEHEIALTHRNLYCLSIMILDLDFFKKINDTFGHTAGDKVLFATAAVLQKCARSTDYVGRFGGEEFLVILPNCDAKGAVEVANRYRKSLEAQRIQMGDDVIQVTGSFGLTTMLRTNTREYNKKMSLDQLISTADKALYDAKAHGRNCVKFRALNEG
jgi:diguanylate cyclase (GGDEF)-like protein